MTKTFLRGFSAFSILALVAILGWNLNNEEGQKVLDKHDKYLQFIEEHPYSEAVDIEEWEQMPKMDRPDLAFRQNFLATMDPALGYPTPERLIEAKARIEAAQILQMQKSAGVLDSNLPGLVWEERGPYNQGGRTRTIMYDPNDTTHNTVWAGAVGGGLWYNTNISSPSSPWVPVDDFWQTLSINCMAYDPTNTQVFYVGTGEHYGQGFSGSRGQGIFKTTDGGLTWSQLSNSTMFDHIRDIVVRDENGQGVLYVGVRENDYENFTADTEGLYRSTDGGQSFTQVMDTIPGTSKIWAVSDLEIDANNRLWVGTTTEIGATRQNNAGGGDILYSDDGLNFTRVRNTDGHRVELACAPSDGSVLYAIIERNGQADKILRSLDTGNTWTSMPKPNDDDPGIPALDFTRGQAWYDLIAAVDPNDPFTLAVGGINLFKSTDSANSWTQISHWYGGFGYPYVHADQHEIVFKPGSSSVVLSGSDGGVAYTSNFTSNTPAWADHNDAYTTTQFYAGAINPVAGSNIMYAGAQDNGTQRVDLPGNGNGISVTGGDGAYCFVDEFNSNFVITSSQRNFYNRSFNGTSFSRVISKGDGLFISPADYDSDLSILWACKTANQVYRFKNMQNASITEESINLRRPGTSPIGFPSNIKVSPFIDQESTVWIGGQNGRLLQIDSADIQGSEVITDITGTNFPAANLSSVEPGRSEDELLVTFSNYGVPSVFYSNDGGQNWEMKEGDLPDMPVRWGLFNPRDSNNVILATELGVWETRNFMDSLPNWAPAGNGMPNVRVDMLQLRQSDYTIMASTHGRGMFTAQFKGGIGLEEHSTANLSPQPKVYPNPINTDFQVDFKSEGIWEMQVFDLQGKRVYRDRWSSKNADRKYLLPKLKPGIYLLHLRKGSQEHRIKLQLH